MSKVVVLKDDCGCRFTMSVPDNTDEVLGLRESNPLDKIEGSIILGGYSINRKQLAIALLALIDADQKIAAIKLLRAATNFGLKEAKDVVDELAHGNFHHSDFND